MLDIFNYDFWKSIHREISRNSQSLFLTMLTCFALRSKFMDPIFYSILVNKYRKVKKVKKFKENWIISEKYCDSDKSYKMSSIAKGVLRLTLNGQRFLPIVSILGQHQGKQHVWIVHPEPDNDWQSGKLDTKSKVHNLFLHQNLKLLIRHQVINTDFSTFSSKSPCLTYERLRGVVPSRIEFLLNFESR